MTAPALTGFHHFSPTVRDLEASVAWYQRIFGMERIPVPFPHWGAEDSGHAVVLMHPGNGMIIGLHHHVANEGETFAEARTGLDHLAFGVATREELDTWTGWLDAHGVAHSGVIDVEDPMRFSTVVFRDPDHIQLELCWFAPQG